MDKWDRRFMEMAHLVATWTSCYTEGRAIGAVIVKDKRVMATGYNGAPAGLKTCRERGECMRRRLGVQSGTHAELCFAIHAEQNAIIQAAKLGISIDGGTLYCTHQPCSMCTRIIINAGIRRVIFQQGYPDDFSLELFHESSTRLERYDPETGETEEC
ncbi:MAG: dCMP deaminase family protein [Clostridia bacterium]|nr:dCMP deaminase family protein [Clostridia bacterium]